VRKPYEVTEHPADVGFIAYGSSLKELFANAAQAMMSLACELGSIEEREAREVEVTGPDLESLLYAWLAEILAEADGEQLVFCRADVLALGHGVVRGAVYGEPYDKARHHAGTYIKAVTFHQLRIEQTADGWRAQVYLDV
jgi:SHS2 domain-containing protein